MFAENGPWWEIDNLLMSVNVDSYHWVLAAFNFVERKIRVYESLCQDTDLSFREQFVSPLAHFLLSLMCNGDYYENKRRKVQLTPFVYKRLGPNTVLQQCGAGHCGAFLLMYVKYIVAHRQKFDFKANQMKALRRKMSIEIFATIRR
ncbi:hypothetical protein ACOSQ3_020460 [Xanthoceras sorbifolium]